MTSAADFFAGDVLTPLWSTFAYKCHESTLKSSVEKFIVNPGDVLIFVSWDVDFLIKIVHPQAGLAIIDSSHVKFL